jgi:hypothetical protein
MIAHSASNCVADLSIGIDKDFFRSLVSMRTLAANDESGLSPIFRPVHSASGQSNTLARRVETAD